MLHIKSVDYTENFAHIFMNTGVLRLLGVPAIIHCQFNDPIC